MFSVQLQLTLTAWRLKRVLSLLLGGKCLSITSRKLRAIFVFYSFTERMIVPNNIAIALSFSTCNAPMYNNAIRQI